MGAQVTSLNTTKTVAIDRGYHWQPVGPDTPQGVKVQLINRARGVAVYGHYTRGSEWTHWAPLPTFVTSTRP